MKKQCLNCLAVTEKPIINEGTEFCPACDSSDLIQLKASLIINLGSDEAAAALKQQIESLLPMLIGSIKIAPDPQITTVDKLGKALKLGGTFGKGSHWNH